MLKLKNILQQMKKTQHSLADYCGFSDATIAQLINHEQWPKGVAAIDLRDGIVEFLSEHGLDAYEQQPFQKVELECSNTQAPDHQSNQSVEDIDMLLRKQTLTPAAKKLFGIPKNPFEELQETGDMWISPDIREVRESMFSTAKHGGFLALVGESGSGKTTTFMDLEERILDEKQPILLMKPHVLATEDNDKKGKTLKVSQIAENMIRTISPLAALRISQEARFAQLEAALRDSYASGYRHCLVIEEAHSLPLPTLKHLKRILELRQGFSRLVSIILIGQPELLMKLSERNSEVREVVQRCEVMTLHPIKPEHLGDFLSYRLKRAGIKLADVIDNTGIAAMIQRLVSSNGASQLYPLAVGNFVVSAMNIAAKIGAPIIDADIINEVV